MKLIRAQRKERDAILADMEAMRLRVTALFTTSWPQIGSDLFYLGEAEECRIEFTGSDADRMLLKHTPCYRTEAELNRHIEALKVHHELRSMTGRTAPPDGGECHAWGIMRQDVNSPFESVNWTAPVVATIALGGVWFSSKESCDNAMKAIGQERLAVLYDDFLQTPTGDK